MEPVNGNLVLIGMSGVGKSTLGVLAAKALAMDFIDTDLLIQRRAGRKLQAILDQEGIEPFLRLEEDVLSGLVAENSVIATGGSAVYSPRAMAALGRGGTIVYLSLPYDELIGRLKSITTRGVVMRAGHTFEDVYRERLPLYRAYADATVDCSGRDVETCVGEILAAWEANRKPKR